MLSNENIIKLISLLENEYPGAVCSLEYDEDYELLFSVRLSAQCTDERVNKVTPALFERYKTIEDFASADIEELSGYIRSCGLFRTKAKDIIECAKEIVSRHNGKVPGTMEELTALPGVGRKTANLVLGDAFKVPGCVVVDTHCIRLSNRIGLLNEPTKDPLKIENQLRKIIPPDKSNDLCHRFVLHGRAVCSARAPKCEICCLKDICEKNL